MNITTLISDISQEIICPKDEIIKINEFKSSSNTPNCNNRDLEQQITNLCEGNNSCIVDNIISGCPKYLYNLNYTCKKLPIHQNHTDEGSFGTGASSVTSNLDLRNVNDIVPLFDQNLVENNKKFNVIFKNQPNNSFIEQSETISMEQIFSSILLILLIIIAVIYFIFNLFKKR